MRALGLLLVAAVAAAEEDLTPREGSGWAGFPTGSWVKVLNTFTSPGKPPTISQVTTTLSRAEGGNLTLSSVETNILKLETKREQVVPATGEAGAGERQSKPEKLPDETVEAAGRKFACAVQRVTVTGAQGRRVITTWTSASPALLVKKSVVTLDGKGATIASEGLTLESVAATHEIGGKKIRCVGYRTESSNAATRQEGTALLSRDVPSGTVRMETKLFVGEREAGTLLSELREFEVK